MDGILFILDQTGRTLSALIEENARLKARVAELEAAATAT